jgi:hypothetical protein
MLEQNGSPQKKRKQLTALKAYTRGLGAVLGVKS